MKFLVTGGAGFIGRWVVSKLLEDHQVMAFDNLSNGSRGNLREFEDDSNFKGLKTGDVKETTDVKSAFKFKPDAVIHAAAQINVQESLDKPASSYENNILGTYNVLEECRKMGTRLTLIGTCMVYDIANVPISEKHPVKPKSPYAASKLAAEYLAESYYHGYGLPVTILRPFNTYGPYQKRNMEGGVVSIFVDRAANGLPLQIFGSGKQTRDLLWVEDCADFIVKAALSEKAVGETINAGTGQDITVNRLAEMVSKGKVPIEHIKHHHPQSEIMKLQCDPSKARKLLGWKPATKLEQGIEILEKRHGDAHD